MARKKAEAMIREARIIEEREKRERETTHGAGSELGGVSWLDALARANQALRTVMNCTESMNAHELSLACSHVIDLIQEAQAHGSASNNGDMARLTARTTSRKDTP